MKFSFCLNPRVWKPLVLLALVAGVIGAGLTFDLRDLNQFPKAAYANPTNLRVTSFNVFTGRTSISWSGSNPRGTTDSGCSISQRRNSGWRSNYGNLGSSRSSRSGSFTYTGSRGVGQTIHVYWQYYIEDDDDGGSDCISRTSTVASKFYTFARAPVVFSLVLNSRTHNSATFVVNIQYPLSSTMTGYYRYRVSSEPTFTTGTVTIAGTATSATFTIPNLAPETTYYLEISMRSNYAEDQNGTFTTEVAPPSVSSVTAATLADGATITFNIADENDEEQTIYYRYRPSSSTGTYTTGTTTVSGGLTTGTFTFSGLLPNTQYTLEASTQADYSNAASVTFTSANAPACTSANVTEIDLGQLPITKDATLPASGTYAGTISDEADQCLSDSKAAQFYEFSMSEGGGVFIKAESDPTAENYLLPSLRILDSVGGTVHYANSSDLAHLSTLGATLDSGNYVVEVRSAENLADTSKSGRFGAYSFTVQRVHPVLIAINFSSNGFTATYEAYTSAPNMQMVIQYKESSATAWQNVSGQAFFRNDAVAGTPVRYAQGTQEDLNLDTDYQVRARFRYATDAQLSEVTSGTTSIFVAFPAPTVPSLDNPVYNEIGEPFSVKLTASWDYPDVQITSGPDGRNWWFQVDWGEYIANVGQSLQTTNTLGERDVGKNLRVRVQAVFRCPEGASAAEEPCGVFFRGTTSFANEEDRLEIPEGRTYYPAWSGDNLFAVQDLDREVTTSIEPDPAAAAFVAEPIRAVTAAAGVQREADRQIEVWSFFICFGLSILAVIAGFFGTGGHNGNPFFSMAVGCFGFFLVWAFAGPEWFGVPTAFAYGTIAVPLMAFALFAITKFRPG